MLGPPLQARLSLGSTSYEASTRRPALGVPPGRVDGLATAGGDVMGGADDRLLVPFPPRASISKRAPRRRSLRRSRKLWGTSPSCPSPPWSSRATPLPCLSASRSGRPARGGQPRSWRVHGDVARVGQRALRGPGRLPRGGRPRQARPRGDRGQAGSCRRAPRPCSGDDKYSPLACAQEMARDAPEVKGGVAGPSDHDQLSVAARGQSLELASDLALALDELALGAGVTKCANHGFAQPLLVPLAFVGGDGRGRKAGPLFGGRQGPNKAGMHRRPGNEGPRRWPRPAHARRRRIRQRPRRCRSSARLPP